MSAPKERLLARVILILAIWISGAEFSHSQSGDIATIEKRYYSLYELGDYSRATAEAQKLAEEIGKRIGVENQFFGRALALQARALQAQKKFAEAEPLYRKTLALFEQAYGSTDDRLVPILRNLAQGLQDHGQYADSENFYKRTLDIQDSALSHNDLEIVKTLVGLAEVYRDKNSYELSQATFERAISILNAKPGTSQTQLADALNGLGTVLHSQGRYDNAEATLKRALKLEESSVSLNSENASSILNNLALVYTDQGRQGEAVALLNRAIALCERENPSSTNLAAMLSSLASALIEQDRLMDAEKLAKRALLIREKSYGAVHPAVARTLTQLGTVTSGQQRYEAAERYYQRALAINEKLFGLNHLSTAVSLGNLASLRSSQRRFVDAEHLLKRALDIRLRLLPPNHPTVSATLSGLGIVSRNEKRFAEANEYFSRALAMQEATLGETHPSTISTLGAFAGMQEAAGNHDKALILSRRAAGAIIADNQAQSIRPQVGGERTILEQKTAYLLFHLSNLAKASRADSFQNKQLGSEAFNIAQWANTSSTAVAIHQMVARFALGEGKLANITRQNQDLIVSRSKQSSRLVEEISKTDGQKDRLIVEIIQQKLSEIDNKLTTNISILGKEFPDYAALAFPKPLNVAEVSSLLKDDEALVFWIAGEPTSDSRTNRALDNPETYVFALSKNDFAWKTIPLGVTELSKKIARFRQGLDVGEFENSVKSGKPLLFDLDLAAELYDDLIEPVSKILDGKRRVFLVPSGPLTALPFNLLLSRKPPVQVDAMNIFSRYRDAAWFVKTYSTTVLPSVENLKSLRSLSSQGQAPKPIIGFGDPIFSQAEGISGQRSSGRTGALSDRLWLGAGIDAANLTRALPRLKDTADELNNVAQSVGAPNSDIFLRSDATETNVKRSRLSDYRIVYFATHGLVAGDIKGVVEPSLVLTLPRAPTVLDDGILRASEISQLKLNADWVVLSACNTAAGDRPGAEALSGLAKAFFYAGARALLVSHWAVDSAAATRLTTSTFRILSLDLKKSPAEAVQQAMIEYLSDESSARNSYPAYWGPFTLIGEGRPK